MINVEETIISQFGESASLTQLIRGIDNYLDPRANIDLFIEQVWDIDTATGWGLDVWGNIIGVSRYVNIPGSGAFYIPDDDYRSYLFLKATTNISNCSAFSINNLISNFFESRGKAYIRDLGNMEMRYVFGFDLTSWEIILFTTTDIFPKTTGVKVDFLTYSDPNTTFSFFDDPSGLGFADANVPGSGGNFAKIL